MNKTPDVSHDERKQLVQQLSRELDVSTARIERGLDNLIAKGLVEVGEKQSVKSV